MLDANKMQLTVEKEESVEYLRSTTIKPALVVLMYVCRRDIHSARIKVASTLVVALLFSLDVVPHSSNAAAACRVHGGTSKMNLDAILRDSVH